MEPTGVQFLESLASLPVPSQPIIGITEICIIIAAKYLRNTGDRSRLNVSMILLIVHNVLRAAGKSVNFEINIS